MTSQARVSITVALSPAAAFEIFTTQIDRWWRRGPQYRHLGDAHGIIHLEPKIGGRLFESVDAPGGSRVSEVGRVSAWEPPQRLVMAWRAANFAPGESTEVEVQFSATAAGTLVTVTHRGWESLPADHPARHGTVGADFCRMIGLWWGQQMSCFRQFCALTSTGSAPGAL